MTCTEEHEALINRRRYQRYEIDTQLQVTLLGLEQRFPTFTGTIGS